MKSVLSWIPGNKTAGIFVFTFIFISVSFLISCSKKDDSNSGILLKSSEIQNTMPGFVNISDGMNEIDYIKSQIEYPISAREARIQGKVIVRFTIKKDGTLENPAILRSLSYDCDNEVLRVIRTMNKWNPGTINGIPVDMDVCMPVKFTLEI